MDRLSRKLGLGGPALPDEFALEAHKDDPLIVQLASEIDRVVTALVSALPGGLGDISGLAGLDRPDGAQGLVEKIDWWKGQLIARPKDDAKTLEAARRVSAATLKRWQELMDKAESEPAYEKESAELADAALDVLRSAGPGGERGQPDGASPELAKDLKNLLLSLSDEQAPDLAQAAGAGP
jgi:hypothetical protein